MNDYARLMLTLRKEVVIEGFSHDLKLMFPFYSSCAYNKTKNRKRVEKRNQLENFWSGGILRRGYNKSISSSIYMYLQAAINISFQVVLTFV